MAFCEYSIDLQFCVQNPTRPMTIQQRFSPQNAVGNFSLNTT